MYLKALNLIDDKDSHYGFGTLNLQAFKLAKRS